MQPVVSEDLYLSFLIPILNVIFHRLLRFRNFEPVHALYQIRYVRSIEDSNLNSEISFSSQNLLDSYGDCSSISKSVQFCGFDDFDDFNYYGRHGCTPSTDFASFKMDYRNALQTIADFEINECRLSATYNGYSILCQFLRIKLSRADNLQQCCSCSKNISTCKCYGFRFSRIQYISCSCTFGRVDDAFCTCDDVPAILFDLDEIRRYQEYIGFGLVKEIFHWSLVLKLMTTFLRLLRQYSHSVREFSICKPIWAQGDYKPP